MKSKMGIIAISALILLLTACGSSTASGGAATNSQSNYTPRGNGGFGGQQQGAQADLMGEVSSVSGNTVTLKLMQMPSFNRDNGQQPGAGSGNGSINGSGNSADGSGGAARSSGGRREDNGQGNGQGFGQGQQWSAQYTGETKTVSIPEGVAISSMGREANGENSRQTLTAADLKAGNILQIWYSDKEKETISRISVMQSIPGTGQNPPDTSDNSNTK